MNMNIYIIIINLICLLVLYDCKDKCYVLSLEGGGDKGSYQAGVLKGMVENLPKEDVDWDVIVGTSVGSINGSQMSRYPHGEEKAAANSVVELWKTVNGSISIYQTWSWGLLEGLFFKTGLYDSSPLRNFIKNYVRNSTSVRKFIIGATNYESGKYVTWDETDLHLPDEFVEAILSSSSVPFFFPMNKFKNSYLIDALVKVNVDISSGINRCLDMGYDQKNIVVDVICTNNHIFSHQTSDGINSIGVISRVLNILNNDRSMMDIDIVQQFFPKVVYRYIVVPNNLPDHSPLDFNPKMIEKMIEIGIKDSIDVIKKGPGVNFDILLNKHRENRMNLHGRKSNRNYQK